MEQSNANNNNILEIPKAKSPIVEKAEPRKFTPMLTIEFQGDSKAAVEFISNNAYTFKGKFPNNLYVVPRYENRDNIAGEAVYKFFNYLNEHAELNLDLLKGENRGYELIIDTLIKTGFTWEPAFSGRKMKIAEFMSFISLVGVNRKTFDERCQVFPWYVKALKANITDDYFRTNKLNIIVESRLDFGFPTLPNNIHTLQLSDVYGDKLLKNYEEHHEITTPSGYKQVAIGDSITRYCATPQKLASLDVVIERLRNTIFNGIINDKFQWVHPEIEDCGILNGGGSVMLATLSEEVWIEHSPSTDLDLFVYGKDEKSKVAMLGITLAYFVELGGKIEQCGAVFRIMGLNREVQIITSKAINRAGILNGFDFSCAKIGFYHDSKSKKDVITATHSWHYFTPRGETYLERDLVKEHRLVKMITRGFKIVGNDGSYVFQNDKFAFSATFPLNLKSHYVADPAEIKKHATTKYFMAVLGPEEFQKEIEACKPGKSPFEGKRIKDMKLWNELQVEIREKMRLDNVGVLTKHVYTEFKGSGDKVYDTYALTNRKDVIWTPVESLFDAIKSLAHLSSIGMTIGTAFDIYSGYINEDLPLSSENKWYSQKYILMRNVKFHRGVTTFKLDSRSEVKKYKAFPSHKVHPYNHSDPINDPTIREIEGIIKLPKIPTEQEIAVRYAEFTEKEVGYLTTRGGWRGMSEEQVAQMRPIYFPADYKQSHYFMCDFWKNPIDVETMYDPLDLAGVNVKRVPLALLGEIVLKLSKGETYIFNNKIYLDQGYKLCKITPEDRYLKVIAQCPVTLAFVRNYDNTLLDIDTLEKSDKLYNVVLNLVNQRDWVIADHVHEPALFMSKLKEAMWKVLQDKVQEYITPENNTPDGIMDEILPILLQDNSLRDNMNRAACHLQHPDPGLPGHHPRVSAARFLVCKPTQEK